MIRLSMIIPIALAGNTIYHIIQQGDNILGKQLKKIYIYLWKFFLQKTSSSTVGKKKRILPQSNQFGIGVRQDKLIVPRLTNLPLYS
jgi:hypothetical protein